MCSSALAATRMRTAHPARPARARIASRGSLPVPMSGSSASIAVASQRPSCSVSGDVDVEDEVGVAEAQTVDGRSGSSGIGFEHDDVHGRPQSRRGARPGASPDFALRRRGLHGRHRSGQQNAEQDDDDDDEHDDQDHVDHEPPVRQVHESLDRGWCDVDCARSADAAQGTRRRSPRRAAPLISVAAVGPR